MAPPPPVPDRTETLAPRESSSRVIAPVSDDPPATRPAVIDDPERYEQVAEHARGGLGRVVRAVDKRLGRTVAVKELLKKNDSNEARFMREAMITARLEHPGIVPVHEAGRWPNGDPYYVMKLVEGKTLKEAIATCDSLRERLALLPHVIAVADAVGYAHSEGVIHRDLKPSNIMVGNFGETIVVDWGLARDRKRDVPEPEGGDYEPSSGSGPCSTVSGKVVGTPAYMSPEQARGELVDERCDVYAIGCVLYELLCGTPPHADITPQATLDRVLAGPPRPLAAAVPHLPGELGTIVAKAMARCPDDRYATATALAEDLRRYQTGKLVSAHTYSTLALLRKKVAQHRGVVTIALASAVALAAVGVASFRRVVNARDAALEASARREEALNSAEKRGRELVQLQAVTALRKDPTATLAWLKTYAIADDDRGKLLDVIDEAVSLGVARHVFRPGDWVSDAVFTADGLTVVAAVQDAKLRAYDLRTGRARIFGIAPSPPGVIELTPDGKSVLSGGMLGEVMMWPLAGGGEPRTLLASSGRKVMSIRFSADGTRILVDREKGSLESVALTGGEPTRLGAKFSLRTAVADEDWSKQVAVTGPNTIAAITPTGSRVLGQTEKAIAYIQLSPGGDLVVVHDGHFLWSVPFAGGTFKKLVPYDQKLLSVEWSPDSKTIAICGHRHDVVLVDLPTGTSRELRGHTDALYTVEWTRDGRSILSASDDGTARVWNVADGYATAVLRGHDDDVDKARFSADERQVVTASFDGSVRVWALDQPGSRVYTEGNEVERLTVTGDDALIKTPTGVGRWNLTTNHRDALFSWAGEQNNLGLAVPSADGELLMVPAADYSMQVRRRVGPPVTLVGHKNMVSRAEFSKDDKVLYTSSFDGTLRRWDLATGVGTPIIDGPIPVRGFALAADGRIAATVGDEARMIAPDGTSQLLGAGGKWCVAFAEFDRVRDRLILNRCDGTLALVDNGRVIELAEGFNANRTTTSSDGTRIAGALGDRTVRLWDATTGELLSTYRGHSDLVMDVAFSPDGSELASGSYDKTIMIWQLGSNRHRTLRGHAGAVDEVEWRDNARLVTGSRDGTIRMWDVPSMDIPSSDDLSRRLDAATSARIDFDRPTTMDGSQGSS